MYVTLAVVIIARIALYEQQVRSLQFGFASSVKSSWELYLFLFILQSMG